MDNLELRQFAASLEACFIEVDRAGVITDCSAEIEEITGYTPQLLKGRNLAEFFAGATKAAALEAYMNLLTSRVPIRMLKISMLHKDHGNASVLLNMAFAGEQQEGQPVFSGMIQVNGQQQVSDLGLTWNEAIDKIVEAVLIINKDMQIVYANSNFYELFGYESHEVINKPLSMLESDSSSQFMHTQNVIAGINETGEWHGVVKRKTKSGGYIPVLLNARSYCNENGEHMGYIGTYLDLRKAKSTEMQNKHYLFSAIEAISHAIENKTPDRQGHQSRIASLCVAIGLELGLENHELDGLRLGALVHDIGKLGLPAEILNKGSQLNELELEYLHSHCQKGAEVFRRLRLPWPVDRIVLQHHERYDGSGYPDGLKKDEILLEARILAVADTLEEICNEGSDSPWVNPIQALEAGKNTLFDPQVVEACVRILKKGEYPEYMQVPGPGKAQGQTRLYT